MTIANYAVNSALKSYKPASMASRYGLDNPKEYIKLGVKGKTQSIFFGKKEKDRSSVYAISSLIDEIVEVPDYIYNGIPKADELPNKQILDFLQDDVQKVEIKYNDRDLEIVRNKPGSKQAWYFTRSKGLLKKDQVLYNMNTILNGIFWFEMKEKIEAPGRQREKNEFYLDPPYAEIRLWGKDGKDLGHILLGSKAFGEDIYVKVPEKNTVYKMLLQSAKNMNLPQFDIKAE